jgi:hypothetical protein
LFCVGGTQNQLFIKKTIFKMKRSVAILSVVAIFGAATVTAQTVVVSTGAPKTVVRHDNGKHIGEYKKNTVVVQKKKVVVVKKHKSAKHKSKYKKNTVVVDRNKVVVVKRLDNGKHKRVVKKNVVVKM